MGLFTPGWLNKNEEKALKAVAKARTQGQLKKIVDDNKTAWNVKRAAIGRITDQKWLAAEVARSWSEPYSLALLDRLTDQSELRKLALTNEKHSPVREQPAIRSAVLERLTDQAALARVMLTEKSAEVRALTLSRITDADAADAAIAALLGSEPFSVSMADGAMELLKAFSGRLPRAEKRLREQIGAVHADTPGKHCDRVGGHTDSSGSHQDASQATVLGSADCHHDYPGKHEDRSYTHTDGHPYRSKLSKLPPYEGTARATPQQNIKFEPQPNGGDDSIAFWRSRMPGGQPPESGK